MPDFDESFLTYCAQSERNRVRSYGVNRFSNLMRNRLNKNSIGKKSPQLLNYSLCLLLDNYGESCAGTPTSTLHKNSLKNNKITKRARSFKDDFLDKISQIRTPTSTLGRSGSPNSPRSKHSKGLFVDDAKPVHGLDYHVRQVKHSLTHFKDVIVKNKLEMLPGNGTVVLESVSNVVAALNFCDDNSNTIKSATDKLYNSLGRLLKLCDDISLHDDDENSASLNIDNVDELINEVDTSLQNLLKLSNEKLSTKDRSGTAKNSNSLDMLQKPTVDANGQRTSLPEISLTPNQRDLLEKSQTNTMRSSHSTESILRESSPPPKPPLPNRISNPPPIPPKRRSFIKNHQASLNKDGSLLNATLDRSSYCSKSPDDNSSLLSASAGSIDSVLNHSREEEELRVIEPSSDELLPTDELYADKYSLNESLSQCKDKMKKLTVDKTDNLEYGSSSQSSDLTNPRISNESGFLSMNSLRSSMPNTTLSNQQLEIEGNGTDNGIRSHFGVHAERTFMSHEEIGMSYSDNNKIQSSHTISAMHESASLSDDNGMFMSNRQQFSREIVFNSTDDLPPALPVKERSRSTREKWIQCQYDNLEEENEFSGSFKVIPRNTSVFRSYNANLTKHQSFIEPRRYGMVYDGSDSGEQPPPLPAKQKRPIMAYMQILGNCSQMHNNAIEPTRHSVHTCNISHSASENFGQFNHFIPHSQTMSLSPIHKKIIEEKIILNNETPPALPPKRSSLNTNSSDRSSGEDQTRISSPVLSRSPIRECKIPITVDTTDSVSISPIRMESPALNEIIPPMVNVESVREPSPLSCDSKYTDGDDSEVVLRHGHGNADEKQGQEISDSGSSTYDVIYETDVNENLVHKRPDEDGPDIKGGTVDALIVHATRSQKSAGNAFAEAFITTFRTLISPPDLIVKLISRYTTLSCQLVSEKQKAAKESFSMLVRVVDDLTAPDLTSDLLTLLNDFVYQLICAGTLTIARVLRNRILEKINVYKQRRLQLLNALNCSRTMITNLPTLLDLKSTDIAEQMTLLDADLFRKIEIPEVLIWAQEQCEERSPNLTRFSEHFNKMSYWARSQILKQEDAKDREKHVIKFIKIMKHLRKINNYNSYLALLSALDSAPIRRLEWHKQITEGLKEYSVLIDSSSSFRAYRQALAETSPPCIPYIGVVLQDLTFVHIGNPDYLSDNVINFAKRWQQYNIVVNVKRFKNCSYPFKKNERIVAFFDNFENYLDEDAMWQISESIKPRISRKPVMQAQ